MLVRRMRWGPPGGEAEGSVQLNGTVAHPLSQH